VRILAVLDDAGAQGVTQAKLIEVAGYAGDEETKRRLLSRELKHLRDNGWDIENAAPAGEPARYVLRARDVRLRVELTPRQQAELTRVAKLAAMDEFARYVGTDADNQGRRPNDHTSGPATTGQVLAQCIDAASNRRVINVIYKKKPRTVHPRVVQPGPAGWYLVGCEEGSDVEKFFAVDRLQLVSTDRPGSARVPENAKRGQLDPATWQVDPYTEVTVQTPAEFANQVAGALGPPISRENRGDHTLITIGVTNRSAFRRRLYGLGQRVRVVGPDQVRDEIVAELKAWTATP
jgi:predicted DNA-binding transcriptional regulator YafY